MTTIAHSPAIEQAHVVKLMDHWVNAIRTKDVDAAMSNYSKNVISFDVVTPLQYFGLDAVRKRIQDWFSTFEGPIGFETHDLRIATDSDVAFAHSLSHVTGTKKDGAPLDMWWRSTVCYRKIDDRWMVTHEHNSVPFDPGSGRASLDLKP
jgi:uncharacterized protein (TIGR02246 family)